MSEKNFNPSILQAAGQGFYSGAKVAIISTGILSIVCMCVWLITAIDDVKEARANFLPVVLFCAYMSAVYTLATGIVVGIATGALAAIRKILRTLVSNPKNPLSN